MREYLDPVVKAVQCAQNVDDIGVAANIATDLTRNILAVFKCNCQAGLKLTIENCHCGVRQVEFLERTISPVGISPKARKLRDFLDQLRFPESKKALERYLGFVNFYKFIIPTMAETFIPFYKLLKTEVPIKLTSDLKETFDSIKKVLSDAYQLALKQPVPEKQLVLMTDASFGSAGYALMIEDNLDHKIHSKRKTYAPVAFGSKTLCPAQFKLSENSKDVLAISMTILEFAHTLREKTKPTIVLTDNESCNFFSKQRQFRQHSGKHMIICFNLISKYHTLLAQSTQWLIFSPDWNSNSWRRYVSKSGKISKQHLSVWPPLPWMLLMRNNFSSHKKTITTSQNNKTLNKKSKPDKTRSKG